MKSSIFILSTLVFLAVITIPNPATADTVCTEAGQSCVNPGGISGVCNASGICVSSNPTQPGNPTNPPQSGNPGSPVTLTNPLGSGATLPWLVNQILGLVVKIGAVVVIFMLVYVGFLFVAARGNDAKLTEARKALLWTVVGALILLGAQAIAIGIKATVDALSVGQ